MVKCYLDFQTPRQISCFLSVNPHWNGEYTFKMQCFYMLLELSKCKSGKRWPRLQQANIL